MFIHLNTHIHSSTPGGGPLAHVRLGSPRFSDCRGVGICEMFLDATPPDRWPCPDWCQARVSVDGPTGRLLLQFLRYSLSERTLDHHFGSGYLKLQHAFRLPPELVGKLGLADGDYVILPGRYPALETEDMLLVSCRIAQPAVRQLPETSRAA